MPGVLLWGWDYTNENWVEVAVDSSGILQVYDPKVGSLISYDGTTTADGATDGSTLVCSDLTSEADFDGNQVIITSGDYDGQARDINGVTTAGTVTPTSAFGGQIVSGVTFTIAAIRTVPAEVAALQADIGDASASTLGSLYAILGNPAQTFLAMIGYEGATALASKLTATRAALLDEITAGRMSELDAANIPADIDTLLTRLSAIRAGYLNELDFDLQGTLAAIAGYIDTEVGAIETKLDTPANFMADVSALALEATLTAIKGAGWTDENLTTIDSLIDTLLTRVTAAVALASVCTEARLAELDAANIPADLATITAYVDTLEAAVGAIEGATTLHNKLTAARAGYLDELAAANIPADIDTLLTRVTAAVALASVCTEARLAELDAANLPADIDTLLTRVTAAVALASVCTEARLAELAAANIPADIDELKASKGRQLFTMDFWSLPQEEVALTVAAGDKALPSVTVGDLPGAATIVRAIAMFKFRMVENHTYAGVNSLDGAQEIQVAASVAAINFVDAQFTLAQDTREGGDVVIGVIDIAATVNANGAYAFHWDLAKALQTGINFNDIQMGIRIWYSV